MHGTSQLQVRSQSARSRCLTEVIHDCTHPCRAVVCCTRSHTYQLLGKCKLFWQACQHANPSPWQRFGQYDWPEALMACQYCCLVAAAGGNYRITQPGRYRLSNGALEAVTGAPCLIVSDLDDTMVGDDAATAAFTRWWQDEAVPRGSRLVYNTGRAMVGNEQPRQHSVLLLPASRPHIHLCHAVRKRLIPSLHS